jgi:predicted ribosomally synthesized peptide with SipW-like signal peptide
MASHARNHSRRTGRARAVMAMGVVLGLGAIATTALWTDSATVAGTTISTGTLDLKVDGQDSVTGYTSLNITNMVPGASVAAVLTIANAGNVPFTYLASSAATNTPVAKDLAGALQLKVTGATSITGASPTATCGGTTLAGTGAALNTGLVTTARPLSAGTNEKICVQITLPSTAANALQGASTAVTLQFDASQVAP